MDIRESAENVARQAGWNASELELELRPMGSANASYRCTYRGEQYVIRLGSRCQDYPAINRHAEKAALEAVSQHGFGAPLVFCDAQTGNRITRYVPGQDRKRSDLREPGTMQDAVKRIRRLHTLRTPYSLDMYKDVENKLRTIREKGIGLHTEFAKAYDVYLARTKKYPLQMSQYRGLRHGDMFFNNFRFTDDGKILPIDYEYAGVSDIFHDLACFSAGWSREEKEQLLKLYFGEYTPVLLQKLYDFSVISWMWNGTWAYLKSCEVPKEQFDYVDFGHQHVDAILKYMGSPAV